MRHQAVALVVGGICVLALAGISGGMVDTTGSPAVEIPHVIEDLLTIPDQTATVEDAESLSTSDTGIGWLGWAPPVILTLWLLGAARYMGAAEAVLSTLVGVCLLGLYWIFTFGGTTTGTTVEANLSDPSRLTTLLTAALLFVVLVTGATMLRPPSGFRSTDWKPVAFLSAVLNDVFVLAERDKDTKPTGDSHLDNEVYQAWQTFITRVDVTEDTSPGEAARVARENGLPPDAVEAIRETFEEVRYGNGSVTESKVSRVQQAIEQLDRSSPERDVHGRDAQGETGLTDTRQEHS